jgi:hypothetical protein
MGGWLACYTGSQVLLVGKSLLGLHILLQIDEFFISLTYSKKKKIKLKVLSS